MYEEFRHPKYIAAQEWLESKLAERRAKIEQWCSEHGIEPTEEIIERHYRGYRRTLIRQIRHRITDTGLHVFVELPVAFLDLDVPDHFPYDTVEVITGYDANQVPITDTQKRTMRQYITGYSTTIDGTKCIFQLGGTLPSGHRPHPPQAAEITLWKNFLTANGFDWSKAGTYTQYKQRLGSSQYEQVARPA
jgi:hypothetical protein